MSTDKGYVFGKSAAALNHSGDTPKPTAPSPRRSDELALPF
jgi:hypothetical protein